MMTLTDTPRPTQAARGLDDETLVEFRARAAQADQANEFFWGDFVELRDRGYLRANLPEHHGGWGWDLARLAAEQRRVARYAPATALATSMHFYWIGLAAELERFGDPSCRFILEAAAEGKIFAAGHAETGNDISVTFSTASARPVPGGWRISGHKTFGSMGPVWDYLGVHAMDTSDPGAPLVVHAFIPRDSEGLRVVERWDTLGMRPSQSYETVLEEVFVPDALVGRVVPAGDSSDPFVALISIWALTLFSSVYTGLAERALEVAVETAWKKSSIAIPRGAYAYNPMVQHQIAEMYLELDAARAVADRVALDWVAGVDHGERWAAQIFGAKWRAAQAVKKVVDLALEVAGGAGMVKGSELERLYRDARCGGFHPGNDAFAHEVVGKTILGVDPSGPRW